MSESQQNGTMEPSSNQAKSLPVERRTYLRSIAAGGVVSGGTAGTTAAADQSGSDSETSEPAQTGCNGGVGYGCVPYGLGRYGGGPPALPGIDIPPRDLNNDGKFEDLDGNGQLDIFDVQALYAHRNEAIVSDYYAVYDFGNDGSTSVDILDVQGLFDNLTS